MIRLASVDTSGQRRSLALVEQDGGGAVRVVREASSDDAGGHATHLLRALERLLGEAGWARSSIDAFAAARGPGSFTGIRIGLGTIRGLALASARPAYGIGTLDALAAAAVGAARERVPLLAAGRGEVFGARFDADSDPPRELVAPWVGPVERAIDPARPEPAILGPGAEQFLDRLRAAGFHAPLASTASTVAASAGRLALLRIAAGARDGDGFAPLYIRPPDAVPPAVGPHPA